MSSSTGSQAALVKQKIPFNLWRSALLICTQSFLFGYVFSCLNTCLLTGENNSGSDCYHGTDDTCPPGTIYNSFNLDDFQAQLSTALCVLGAWIGSFLGSNPSEKYGRRPTLLWNNALFIVGSIMSASGNIFCLFIGRLIAGFGVGVASSVPAVLLSEIASDAAKGTITTLHQLSITFAIFVAAMLGYGFVTYVANGWQYILAFAIIPCLVFILSYAYVPESPKWLLGKNRRDEAYKALVLCRSSDSTDQDIQRELNLILMADKESNTQREDPTWGEVFSYKKAIIIGSMLMVFQTLTGINAVIIYSTSIFGFAGFDQPIIGTATVTFLNFLCTLGSVYVIDSTGRKTLLNIGTTTMMVSLIILAAVLLDTSSDVSVTGVVAVAMILVYICGFAIGLGAVLWILMSEMVPTRIRSKAMSCFICVNWALNLVITLTTLTTINTLGGVSDDQDDGDRNGGQKKGVAYLFIIFASFAVGCLIFLNTYVPETRGKTADELARYFKPSYQNDMLASAFEYKDVNGNSSSSSNGSVSVVTSPLLDKEGQDN